MAKNLKSHLSVQVFFPPCKSPLHEAWIHGAVLFPALPFSVNDRFAAIFQTDLGVVIA